MSWKLFKTLVSQSLQEALSYRATSFIVVIFGFLFFSIEIITGIIYFEYSNVIAGWSRNDYLLLISSASLITYLYHTFFIVSHENLSEVILEGELDYTLLRPVNSFFYYAFNRIDFPSLVNVLIALGVQIYVLTNYTLSFINLLVFFALILVATWLLFLINQVFIMTAFWKDRGGKFLAIPEYLSELSSRPAGIYPKILRYLLSWALPLLMAFNAPILFIKQDYLWLEMIWYILFTIGLTALTMWLWKKGLRKYQSAS